MAFERPSLSELITRAQADMSASMTTTGAWLRRSILGVLSRVLAGAAHGLYGYIQAQSKNLFTDTADEDHVRREAAQYGLTPVAATYAKGSLTVTGTIGSVIPAGTVLQRADGVEFSTNSLVTLAATSASLAVTAVSAGIGANTAALTPLSFVSPVSGVASSATVAVGGITQGADEEGLESLRARLLSRKRNPAQGGSESDFIRWVQEIFPSARVWIYPLMMGPRSVGITFVLPDRGNIIPVGGDITAVEAHLDPLRPVTSDLTIFAPIAAPLNISLWVSPDTPAVRAAVAAEIQDLILREAEPGGTILLTKLNEAISIAPGENNHAIATPNTDVTVAAGSISTMGTITWTAAP